MALQLPNIPIPRSTSILDAFSEGTDALDNLRRSQMLSQQAKLQPQFLQQKLDEGTLANIHQNLENQIRQQELEANPELLRQKLESNALINAHQQLQNQYYGASQLADISWKNAQATELPSESAKNYQQSALYAQQARQAKQQMDILQKGMDEFFGNQNIPSSPMQGISQATQPQELSQAPSQMGATQEIPTEMQTRMPSLPEQQAGSQEINAAANINPTQTAENQLPSQQYTPTTQPEAQHPAYSELQVTEPFQLKQDKLQNFYSNFSPKMTSKSYLDGQQQNLRDFNKEMSDANKGAVVSNQILDILNQMEDARKGALLKGNKAIGYLSENLTAKGQQVGSLWNTLIGLQMPEMKTGGRVTNAMIGLLKGAKPTMSLLDPAWNTAINNIKARAIATIEYQKILNSGQSTYRNNRYGIAAPLDILQTMYDNYRGDHPIIDARGNMIYDSSKNNISNYVGLPALYSASSNIPYSLKVPGTDYTIDHFKEAARKANIPVNQLIRLYKQKKGIKQ